MDSQSHTTRVRWLNKWYTYTLKVFTVLTNLYHDVKSMFLAGWHVYLDFKQKAQSTEVGWHFGFLLLFVFVGQQALHEIISYIGSCF